MINILSEKERNYWIDKQNLDENKQFAKNYKYVIKSRTKKKIAIAFNDLKIIAQRKDFKLNEFIKKKVKEFNDLIISAKL